MVLLDGILDENIRLFLCSVIFMDSANFETTKSQGQFSIFHHTLEILLAAPLQSTFEKLFSWLRAPSTINFGGFAAADTTSDFSFLFFFLNLIAVTNRKENDKYLFFFYSKWIVICSHSFQCQICITECRNECKRMYQKCPVIIQNTTCVSLIFCFLKVHSYMLWFILLLFVVIHVYLLKEIKKI